jgi:hypothetical protein
MKVFVSYTTRDPFISKDYLETIDKVISEYANSFIDLLHNTANEKQEFVKQELLSSDVVLLISSISTPLSPWVTWELKQAQNEGIPIIEIPVEENGLLNSLLEIRRMLPSKLTRHSNGLKTAGCFHSVQHFSQQF